MVMCLVIRFLWIMLCRLLFFLYLVCECVVSVFGLKLGLLLSCMMCLVSLLVCVCFCCVCLRNLVFIVLVSMFLVMK